MPGMTTPDPELIQQLVDANHILTNEGVLDGFGHVSARHDKDPGRFLLARNLAPAFVTADDLQEYDLESSTRDTRRTYLEKFIHGEIYRARPDVMAVAHSPSPSSLPFGLTGRRLGPVFHMCGFLGGPVPVFEIRDAGGLETNMLVRNRELGSALAKTLGDRPFALMRGHGSVAVGPSVKHVVYRAIYAAINARLQQDALLIGHVTYLNDADDGDHDDHGGDRDAGERDESDQGRGPRMGAQLLRHAPRRAGEGSRDDRGEQHQPGGPDPPASVASERRELVVVMPASARVLDGSGDHRRGILVQFAAAEGELAVDAGIRAEHQLAAGHRGVAAHGAVDGDAPGGRAQVAFDRAGDGDLAGRQARAAVDRSAHGDVPGRRRH